MVERDPREPTPKSEERRGESGTVDGPRAEGPLPLPVPRRAKAPAHRPPWLVVLSAITLVYGGMLLVSSLDTLRDPRAVTHLPLARAMTPAEDEIARQLADIGARVVTAHAGTIRGNAAASLPVALLMLFAAAAMLSRDRRGRQLALAAAWTGIVYQVATLALTFPIVRDYARQAAPLLARLVALQANAPDPGLTPEVLAKVVVAFPVFTSAVAIAGSFVLIGAFGGRRGRVLYGLEGRRS
ncbi:MAG TPA: hypothetical protein VMT47_13270 [Polyangia bacterium]|jgi:hypothetical protein|nr:hypothetical protein [Polyangia bacterium]